jgi:hypothetical protein
MIRRPSRRGISLGGHELLPASHAAQAVLAHEPLDLAARHRTEPVGESTVIVFLAQMRDTSGDAIRTTRGPVFEILHNNSASGKTEVSVMNGATNYTSWIGGWVTPDGWHSGNDASYAVR